MPSEHDSLELIQQAQQGDHTALDGLMRKHMPSLRAFVRLRTDPRLRPRESSADVVQSACREALQNIGNYEWQGEGSFRHWLFTLAMNKLKHKKRFHGAARRDMKREAPMGANDDSDRLAEIYRTFSSPSQHAIAHEVVSQVEAALDKIPEQFREVILLSRVVGLNHEEIAQRMDKSEGAVRMLLHRALARLSTAMKHVQSKDAD